MQVLGSARPRRGAGGRWPLGETQHVFSGTLSPRQARSEVTGVRVRGWGCVTLDDDVFGSELGGGVGDGGRRIFGERRGGCDSIDRTAANDGAVDNAGHCDLSVQWGGGIRMPSIRSG
jgi:hypothetical protein